MRVQDVSLEPLVGEMHVLPRAVERDESTALVERAQTDPIFPVQRLVPQLHHRRRFAGRSHRVRPEPGAIARHHHGILAEANEHEPLQRQEVLLVRVVLVVALVVDVRQKWIQAEVLVVSRRVPEILRLHDGGAGERGVHGGSYRRLRRATEGAEGLVAVVHGAPGEVGDASVLAAHRDEAADDELAVAGALAAAAALDERADELRALGEAEGEETVREARLGEEARALLLHLIVDVAEVAVKGVGRGSVADHDAVDVHAGDGRLHEPLQAAHRAGVAAVIAHCGEGRETGRRRVSVVEMGPDLGGLARRGGARRIETHFRAT